MKMKKLLENQYLSLIARVLVSWIFIYAAIGKIADPQTFSKEISNYALFPMFLINISAIGLPWLELFTGILLLLGIRIKANSIITGGLLVVFIIAVLSAMFRGLNINCGCFSHKIVYVGWTKVLENTGLLLCTVYLFFYPMKQLSIERFINSEE